MLLMYIAFIVIWEKATGQSSLLKEF